jgi:hypothetical protein
MARSQTLFRAWAVISVLWLMVALIAVANDWSGNRVSSRSSLIINEGPSDWGRLHPECRDRLGFWPDGERMPPEVLDDKYGDFIRQHRNTSPEAVAKDDWAHKVRAEIEDCEEAQWLPIARDNAIAKERASLLASAFLPPLAFYFVGLGASWAWRRAAPYERWRTLPPHMRRGFVRLYMVMATPWVLWFGYRVLRVYEQHPHYLWRYGSGDILLLLALPIGAPILFIAIAWIILGFRHVPSASP